MRIYSISSDLKEVKHNFDTNSPFKSNKKVVFIVLVTLSWNLLCWKLIILIAWSQYPLWALLVWKLYLSSPKQSLLQLLRRYPCGILKKDEVNLQILKKSGSDLDIHETKVTCVHIAITVLYIYGNIVVNIFSSLSFIYNKLAELDFIAIKTEKYNISPSWFKQFWFL